MEKKTAIELGFKPKFERLSKEQSELFINILFSEIKQIPEKELPHVIRILDKRIEVMKLPIKFNLKAKLLLFVLTDSNPGRMMLALIDSLTKYEGKEVTEGEICDIYPEGFYSEESVLEYVEKYCKTRLCKWSEIY